MTYWLGRVKTYNQWLAWVNVQAWRVYAEISFYWHGVGLVLGPGCGFTLYLLFCSIEAGVYRRMPDDDFMEE